MNKTEIADMDVIEGPTFLNKEYESFLENGVYVVVFLSVLLILGTVGNIQVLLIYINNYQHSNVKIFIMALAISDLAMCTLAIPVFIFDTRRHFTYIGDGICQLSRLTTVSLSLMSMLLQTLIAVERYKKVCKPLSPQWTPKQVTIATISILVFSIIASSPTLVTIGRIQRNSITSSGYHLQGYSCGAKLKFANFIHAATILPLTTLNLVIGIVLYALILRSIIKRKAFSRVFEMKAYNRRLSTVSHITEETMSNEYSVDSPEAIQSSLVTNNNLIINQNIRERKMDKASRTSVMFMFVFIFSYIGTTPIIALNIVRATDSEKFRLMQQNLGQFMEILLFGGLFNNVINPFVYLTVDEKFRYYWIRLYTLLCQHGK